MDHNDSNNYYYINKDNDNDSDNDNDNYGDQANDDVDDSDTIEKKFLKGVL